MSELTQCDNQRDGSNTFQKLSKAKINSRVRGSILRDTRKSRFSAVI